MLLPIRLNIEVRFENGISDANGFNFNLLLHTIQNEEFIGIPLSGQRPSRLPRDSDNKPPDIAAPHWIPLE
jgi:hypothetical protein